MKKVIFFLIVGSVLAVSCEMLENHEVYAASPESSRFSFAESGLSLVADEIVYLPFVADNAAKKTGNMYLSYDAEVVEITEGNAGLFIKALKRGTTNLTATVGEYATTCVINVDDQIEKTIQVTSQELRVTRGDSSHITATLTNGTPADLEDFNFFTADETVTLVPYGNVCLVAGMEIGSATVTISHSLAATNKLVTVFVE
jgi:hypothetical protein